MPEREKEPNPINIHPALRNVARQVAVRTGQQLLEELRRQGLISPDGSHLQPPLNQKTFDRLMEGYVGGVGLTMSRAKVPSTPIDLVLDEVTLADSLVESCGEPHVSLDPEKRRLTVLFDGDGPLVRRMTFQLRHPKDSKPPVRRRKDYIGIGPYPIIVISDVEEGDNPKHEGVL